MSIRPPQHQTRSTTLLQDDTATALALEIGVAQHALESALNAVPDADTSPAHRDILHAGRMLARLAQRLRDQLIPPSSTDLDALCQRLGAIWARFAPPGSGHLTLATPPDMAVGAVGDDAVLLRLAFLLGRTAPPGPVTITVAILPDGGLQLALRGGARRAPGAALQLLADHAGAHLRAQGADLHLAIAPFALPASTGFDPQALPHLFDLAGPQIAQELLTRYDADLTQAESDLAQGITASDWPKLRQATHVLISLAGTAGAHHLCQLARDLHAAAVQTDGAACRKLAGPALTELARLLAVLHGQALPHPATP